MMKRKKLGLLSMAGLIIIGIFASLFYPNSSTNDARFNAAAYPPSNIFDGPAPLTPLYSAVKFTQAGTGNLGGAALDDQGKVWTFGYNISGYLGIDKTEAQQNYAGGMMRVPYFVTNNIHIVSIEIGYETMYAIDDQGNLYAWGRGYEGQVGKPASQLVNITPYKVVFPDGVKIKKAVTTVEAASAVYAISEDGRVFAWGYADGYRIPDYSGFVTTPKEIPSFSAISIADMDLGNQHGVILDDQGDIYSFGYEADGRLGFNPSGDHLDVPEKIPFFKDKKVKAISAGAFNSLAYTEDNVLYQFGQTWTGVDAATSYWEPTEVKFDSSSASYMPEISFMSAGKYVNYAIDTYGRIWSWGWNIFYGFMHDGPLFPEPGGVANPNRGKHREVRNKATIIPQTMGDGDTEEYIDSVKAPVFSKFSGSDTFLGELLLEYTESGNFTDILGGNHPTIYDKKYCETIGDIKKTGTQAERHSEVFLADDQGRKLVYVVRRDGTSPTTYSGNYYVADKNYAGKWIVDNRSTTALPANVTEETSVPAIKEDEQSWISASVDLSTHDWTGYNLKEVPFVTGVTQFQSSTMIIDKAGNLYKTAYNGSGNVAWGWDVHKVYDEGAGHNLPSGLYNSYMYEVMFMRGAPTLKPSIVKIENPIKKIYKSEDVQEQVSDIKIKIGAGSYNAQLNFTLEPELTQAKYVVIPYDPADKNFDITSPSYEDFEEAYKNSAYQKGDLIDLNKDNPEWADLKANVGEPEINLTDKTNIVVNENSILWVMSEISGYSAKQVTISRKVYDNYYTDTTVYHDGKNSEAPKENVYEVTNQYVEKTNGVDEKDKKYGIPLDKNGEVIDDPHFGYDEVSIRAFEESDPEYPQYIKGWYILEGTETSAMYSMNDLKYLETATNQFVRTFLYKRDVKGWVTITYKGRYLGSQQDIAPFEMDGLPGNDGIVNNKETVKKSTEDVTFTLTRTPVELKDAQVIYYKIDGGSERKLIGGKLEFDTIKYGEATDMEVIIYYNQAELFIRQMIMNDQEAAVVPSEGYFRLINTDGTNNAGTYNKMVRSGKTSDTVAFKKVNLNTDLANNQYTIDPVLPEFYKYYGYRISATEAAHAFADLKQAPETVTADFGQQNKYYVTIYLEPALQSKDVPFYNWDYKLNEFGSIK